MPTPASNRERSSFRLVRAPLLPLAVLVAAALFTGRSGGAELPTFDPQRPVVLDVVVPLLGAHSWQPSEDGWAARVRVVSTEQGGRRVRGPKRAWLRFPDVKPPPPELRLRVRGYLSRRPSYRNLVRSRPGEWGMNAKSRLLVASAGEAPGPLSGFAAGMRQRLFRSVERNSRPGAVIARALVFGDPRGLPPEWRTGLKRAGLSHLLAVSGLHVGLLLGGCWWLFGAFSIRLAFLGGAFILVLYGCLVGPRPSLLRAGLMALLLLVGLFLERPPQALNSLCVAFILILLFDSDAIFDIGFQLSFLATAGILVLSPRLAGHWRGGERQGPPHPLVAGLAATVAAQIAVMPIVAAEIGLLAPLSPAFNLVFVPWTALMLGLALFWVSIAALAGIPVLAALVEPIAASSLLLLDLLSRCFALLAELPTGAWLAFPLSVDLVAGLALAGWLTVLITGVRRAVYGLSVILYCAPALPDGEPRLVMLDVGQGDAVLLRSGDRGPVILVDGGGFRRGNFAEAALLSALAAEGVHRIDLAVLSHGDADHCRGLLELSRYLQIGTLWASPVEIRTGCGRDLAERLQGRVRLVGRRHRERVGAFRLEVHHPTLDETVGGNSASLVVRACAGGGCALLVGDLDLAGERELLAFARGAGWSLGADALKVGHHGSRTSTGETLLEAVAPSVALVSAGRQNSYGHPAMAVLSRLKRRRVLVLRTDRHGRIELRFRAGRVLLADVAVWPTAAER